MQYSTVIRIKIIFSQYVFSETFSEGIINSLFFICMRRMLSYHWNATTSKMSHLVCIHTLRTYIHILHVRTNLICNLTFIEIVIIAIDQMIEFGSLRKVFNYFLKSSIRAITDSPVFSIPHKLKLSAIIKLATKYLINGLRCFCRLYN